MQLTVREFIRRYNEQRSATVLLTSHYMDDVASLCRRVIVIDQGRLRYDGDLAELVRSLRPDKRIALRLAGHDGGDPQTPALGREALERVGKIVDLPAGRAILRVKQENLREAVGFLLGLEGVTDLTVEDPPLEEVMRELFSANGSDPPKDGAPPEAFTMGETPKPPPQASS
jgi:ABC-2 type transport system ATP-binding protein